jgi:hypothetical protein
MVTSTYYVRRDGLVVSVLASSAKSVRVSRNDPRSDQTLTSLGMVVQWLAFWLFWSDTAIK